MISLKEFLAQAQKSVELNVSEKKIQEAMLQYLCEVNEDNIYLMLQKIHQFKEEKVKERIKLLNVGMDNSVIAIGQLIMVDPNSISCKNIPYFINWMKAAFPIKMFTENAYYAFSDISKQVFDHYCQILYENKDEYLEGKSKEWAVQFEHYDYIKAVVEYHKATIQEN